MRNKGRTYGLILLAIMHAFSLAGQQFYEAEPLPVNTSSKELAPSFYGNGIVFCSDRKNEWFISYTDLNNDPLTNLYWTEQKKPGKFGNPQLFSKDLSTRMFDGPATFSKDGNTMYFTRNIDIASRSNRQRQDTTFGIFSARQVNGEWTDIRAFPYNSPDFNTGYPCLSAGGDSLFFCTNDPAGFGGYDLYLSIFVNGTWGQPENLGNTVNTAGNEIFPFLHDNGKLYFASRGYNSEEDLDIYYSEYIDDIWSLPVTLPEPFNSAFDDYGLIMNVAMDTGYFVSDRVSTHDIFMAFSTLPTFSTCQPQEENNYCYIFYESNNAELDTTTFEYEWNLGDGTRVRSLKTEHCYAAPGAYDVELNVIDKLTGEAYFSQASYRLVVEQIEQPYISMPDSAYAGDPVSFSSAESFFIDFEAGGWYWDFGDGTRAASMDAVHTYSRPGRYTVQLGLTGRVENIDAPVEKKCVVRTITVLEKTQAQMYPKQ